MQVSPLSSPLSLSRLGAQQHSGWHSVEEIVPPVQQAKRETPGLAWAF